jgi:hypothetical protein
VRDRKPRHRRARVAVRPAQSAVGVAAVACAALLATLGAITAFALAVRMRAGQYRLPARLRLPLPAAMRPPTG